MLPFGMVAAKLSMAALLAFRSRRRAEEEAFHERNDQVQSADGVLPCSGSCQEITARQAFPVSLLLKEEKVDGVVV
jgi:hypothetical protein